MEMTKKKLREMAEAERNRMDAEQISACGERIRQQLFAHFWYEISQTIFVYISVGNEVQTHPIIHKAICDGKTVCVPRVVPREKMLAVPIKNIEEDLEPGFFHIPEPKKHLPPVPETEIELVIAPGLLFDRQGYRIGYGGGYYDKYLRGISPKCRTIGIAYQNQIVDRLPHDAHDVPVMLIITDKEIIGG